MDVRVGMAVTVTRAEWRVWGDTGTNRVRRLSGSFPYLERIPNHSKGRLRKVAMQRHGLRFHYFKSNTHEPTVDLGEQRPPQILTRLWRVLHDATAWNVALYRILIVLPRERAVRKEGRSTGMCRGTCHCA